MMTNELHLISTGDKTSYLWHTLLGEMDFTARLFEYIDGEFMISGERIDEWRQSEFSYDTLRSILHDYSPEMALKFNADFHKAVGWYLENIIKDEITGDEGAPGKECASPSATDLFKATFGVDLSFLSEPSLAHQEIGTDKSRQ